MRPSAKTQPPNASMRLMFVALTLFVAGVGLLTAQDISKDRPPVKLAADSTRTLIMPPFAMRDIQCDDSGNLYFGSGYHPRKGVVLKLSTTGSTTLFKMADAAIEDPILLAFQITPEHKVWMFVAAGKKDKPYVVQFNDHDPSSARTIRLKGPDGMKASGIRSFGILANDKIVVAGDVDASAANGKRKRQYLTVFDDSGNPIRESSPGPSKDALEQIFGRSTAVTEGGITYLLQVNRVLLLSPTGEISRSLPLSLPAPGYHAAQVKVNRRRLAITFHKPKGNDPSGGPVETLFALVDATTGELLRVYEPTADVGAKLACFSDQGFTFVHFNFDRKPPYLSLVTAAVK